MQSQELSPEEREKCLKLFRMLDIYEMGQITFDAAYSYFQKVDRKMAKDYCDQILLSSRKRVIVGFQAFQRFFQAVILFDINYQAFFYFEKKRKLMFTTLISEEQQIIVINKSLLKMVPQDKIYFQTQARLSAQCGLCAINNLIGSEVFSNYDFDKICSELSQQTASSFKSIFGGDYDVSVLISALSRIGFHVRWLKEKESIVNVLESTSLKGFIVNIQQQSSVSLFFKKMVNQSGRHWISIKMVQSQRKQRWFYIMDSYQKTILSSSIKQMQSYLEIKRAEQATILVVELQSLDNLIKSEEQGLKQDEQNYDFAK